MREKSLKIFRWVPVAATLFLVVLVILVCARTLKELNDAVSERRKAFQVVLDAQRMEDDLVSAQADVRRFASEGKPDLLIQFQNDTNAELKEISKLVELTKNDSEEQRRLRALDSTIKAVFELDNRIIGVYARQGRDAAKSAQLNELDAADHAISDLEHFKADEESRLEQRESTEQSDFHKAVRVLIVASLVVTGLLVLANYLAGREMIRRRAVEVKQLQLIEELQDALSKIKTLSGLIPICAWCKKVRSDQGFWHEVEHYVSSHTDASFTHAMCPICVEKWKADARTQLGDDFLRPKTRENKPLA